MKTPALLILFTFLASLSSFADQLAYLKKEDALKVEQLLRQRELLISFCSECDESNVVLWHINHAEARYTGHETYYEIYVSGWPIVQSMRPVAEDEMPSQVAVEYVQTKTKIPKTFPIDLAYTYVWNGTHWMCLGKLQGLACEVRVEEFRL